MTQGPEYRADHLSCPLNAGKLGKVRDLVATLRRIAKQEACLQWQQFHQGGWTSFESMAKKGWSRPWVKDGRLNTTFSQLVMSQVAASLKGFWGNVQNTYTELVTGSSLSPQIRHQLHFINRRQAWFWDCPVNLRQSVTVVHPTTGKEMTEDQVVIVESHVRALARTLIRRALAQHRLPHFKAFQPQLDQRVCFVQASKSKDSKKTQSKAQGQPPSQGKFAYWLAMSTGQAKERLYLPLEAHPAFLKRNTQSGLYQALAQPFAQGPAPVGPGQGFLAHQQALDKHLAERNPYPSGLHVPNTVRLMLAEDGETLTVGLVSDMAAAFDHQAATYQPLRPSLTLDMGVCTLLATDGGELHGRGWMQTLEKFDTLLTAIARHRQRLGLPVASDRYRHHVQRLRGWLKTEIHRILNRLLARKRPSMFILEHLDFRSPRMSRRMNRLIQNFGQGVIRRKLHEFERQYGITVEYRDAAYSSQQCVKCDYTDARNRLTQAKFQCKFCNRKCQADIQASRVLTSRRSACAPGRSTRAARQRTLMDQVHLFNERFPRPRGGPADPRFTNPYFSEWAKAHSDVKSEEGCRAEVNTGFRSPVNDAA